MTWPERKSLEVQDDDSPPARPTAPSEKIAGEESYALQHPPLLRPETPRGHGWTCETLVAQF
jgi:hypothetical protein